MHVTRMLPRLCVSRKSGTIMFLSMQLVPRTPKKQHLPTLPDCLAVKACTLRRACTERCLFFFRTCLERQYYPSGQSGNLAVLFQYSPHHLPPLSAFRTGKLETSSYRWRQVSGGIFPLSFRCTCISDGVLSTAGCVDQPPPHLCLPQTKIPLAVGIKLQAPHCICSLRRCPLT